MSSDNGGREDAECRCTKREERSDLLECTGNVVKWSLHFKRCNTACECSDWCRGRDPASGKRKRGREEEFYGETEHSPLPSRPDPHSHCTNKTRSGSRTIFGFRPCHASRGRGDGMGIDPRAKLKRIRDDADSSRDTANNNNHTSNWTFVTVHCAKE